MSNYEATKYDFSGANLTGIEGIPTATIVPWSSASVPTGFLECNGQAVSRSTYADLFAIVATTYGTGDGSSTFNVPDLQDNVAVGKSNNKALASTGGANTVSNSGNVGTNINVTGNVGGSTANATLSTSQLASHSHNTSIPSSTSAPAGITGVAPVTGGSRNFGSSNQGSGGGHSHNMSATFSGSGNASSTFSGSANSVVQPYLTIIYIIKT
jgi:microcystin-dependent protein